ncbi:MAG: S8/S53 family peptidase [Bacteroidota bacterium]
MKSVVTFKQLVCLGAFTAIGFSAGAQAKLSANLQQYLKAKSKQQAYTHAVYSKQNNTTYIGALLKVTTKLEEERLLQLGVLIGTKAGDIYTVQIPEDKLSYVLQLKGIDYIQLDEPITANLDAARKSARVDSVQNGINLPMSYTGKNVVVGIIDAGFNYNHPAFYDTTGTLLRLKRVWEQRNVGTPPIGFSYGNELTDTTTMITKGYEVNSFSHGTHVGGIAAGSGYTGANNVKYRGVAYESDLVFVGIRPEKNEWKTAGMSSIIDAANYIFTYAKSVGKPAVANLSWGCSIGPNDGSSLFAQALDNLCGPGRIFVNSAGNNGDENIHLQKQFSTTDTVVHSFVTFPLIAGEKRSWIDIWGEAGKTFSVQLRLFNGATEQSTSGYFTLNNTTTDTFLIGSNNDTSFFTLTATASEYNGKPHILIDAFSKTTNSFCVSIQSTSGNIHAWLGFVQDYSGHYGAFTNNNQIWAVNGDSKYTLGEMSCTRSAVTVAAYVSKSSFKNLAGTTQNYGGFNQIAPFSSKGPTVDGRMKPNIAAPGMTIASSVNSYDVSYVSGGGNYAQSVAMYTLHGRDYYYAEASGTSMSSPMVSGIVALLLQVNPELNPQRIQSILAETAFKDNATTQTPDSSRWGAGKANAYAAIKKAIQTVGLESVDEEVLKTVQVFPNPNDGNFQLELSSQQSAMLHVEITNILGQTISINPWNINNGQNTLIIRMKNETKGIYFINIMGAGRQLVKKIIVN